MSSWSAFALAGGLGMRLRSVLPGTQKVLAPVGGRPIVTYVLDLVAKAGADRAVLGIGHRGDQVEQTLGARHLGMALDYSAEPEPLGTAGALRLALPLLQGDPIVCLNGDTYADMDLGAFLSAHRDRGARVSVAVARVEDASRYGSVAMDHLGAVTGFAEKAASVVPAAEGWVNAGVYVLDRAVVADIPTGRAVSLERDVLPACVGNRMFAWTGVHKFIDIGTPESYSSAQTFFAGRVP